MNRYGLNIFFSHIYMPVPASICATLAFFNRGQLVELVLLFQESTHPLTVWPPPAVFSYQLTQTFYRHFVPRAWSCVRTAHPCMILGHYVQHRVITNNKVWLWCSCDCGNQRNRGKECWLSRWSTFLWLTWDISLKRFSPKHYSRAERDCSCPCRMGRGIFIAAVFCHFCISLSQQ